MSFCPHGFADVVTARRRFDRIAPGLKGNGFSRRDIVAALHRDGGVLIEYAARSFHSRSLHDTGNWPQTDEAVTAEASLVAHPSGRAAGYDTVYTESSIWKRGRRIDGVFYPWSTAHGGSSPCTSSVARARR